MQTHNKPVAVVTGAASGIGEATAILLAERGYETWAFDVNGDRLAALPDVPGLERLALDISDEQDLGKAIEAVAARSGRLDAVAAVAGVSLTAPLADTRPEDWDRVMSVNLRGVFLLARATAPWLLRSQRASFVGVASELGTVGKPGLSAYGAAKAGVINLMRVLALEYAEKGVRFNTVAPGGTHTPMMEREQERLQLTLDDVAQGNPMKRLARPAEIAAVIEFLLSPGASFVNGATIVADGGYTAR
ncbi:SDR family oxidoreductase [Mesorhizobium sp.]|uniref:SDR family NAD(P)-dependent oxidoreductase n=1 Tax=Mesorhizobium sp. TaxID=1871066 RepID=UPI0025E1801F|nr:SDR family oxidoreductase [Mesorhizobium sp.]